MATKTQRILTSLDLMIDAFLNLGLALFAIILMFYQEWDRALLCLIASYIIELGFGNKLNKLRQQIGETE